MIVPYTPLKEVTKKPRMVVTLNCLECFFSHRGSPAGCTKECNSDVNCEKLPLQSMKRVAYQFWKDVDPRDFSFTYTTGFNNRYYNVSFRLKGKF